VRIGSILIHQERATFPVQLIAYHIAAPLGTDVDQLRNSLKSVTVE